MNRIDRLRDRIYGPITMALALAMSCVSSSSGQTVSTNEADAVPTIVFSTGSPKPPAFLYAAKARAKIRVSNDHIEQQIDLTLRIVQGQGETISLGFGGEGDVVDVQGDSIAAWAVRTAGAERFLDLQLVPVVSQKPESNSNAISPPAEQQATVQIRSRHARLPVTVSLAHLKPGKALGFDSQIQIEYAPEVAGKVIKADGFAPLASSTAIDRLQTATGGTLTLQLDRSSAVPPPVRLDNIQLNGQLHATGKSMRFELRGDAVVNVIGSRVRALSGNVAINQLPDDEGYRLELANTANGPVYELVFLKSGQVKIALDFEAAVKTDANNYQYLDFTVAASAVVPFKIVGLSGELEFAREADSILPSQTNSDWQGYLPATGRVKLRWRSARGAVESKTFFTTNSTVEVTVGPGLMRQEHRIAYQLLQGQLPSLTVQLVGPGEVLSVDVPNIVGWKITGEGNQRLLEITLNQPLVTSGIVTVLSQTPLGDFPVRVEGMSLRPQGAIRNSGHVRLTNSGSVRVEPTALRGLTQLAPEQFPGPAIQARQLFVYRFPSADYGFTVVADRVQPEITATQLVLYQLSESDRVIIADIELDIREAAIRQWNIGLPEDYSLVSAGGASVADYMTSNEPSGGVRNLKILFNQDVQGRQLVSLRLERNEVASAGSWTLPPLLYPDANTVRGDIGVVTAPGFRATVNATELLVEKPLAYFPRPVPNLQQAFRIREPGWSATMQIEQLPRSVQADTFHLVSLSQGTVYGSALVNYTITGAPVAEYKLNVPAALGNVTVDGQDIRNWRREGDTLLVSLQQPILGTYTLLVTYEEKPNAADRSFQVGVIAPLDVQGDRGYIEVVSPVQVEMETLLVSNQLLVLDPLELPAEFRLLSTAPALGTWQYTQRPFDLRLKVNWFDPGTTAPQVVEFSEANSRVSSDGELVTDVVYFVKSRGERSLKLRLPGDPVRLWAVAVNGQPITARQAGDDTLIPLPGVTDPNAPIEVSLRLGKPASDKRHASLELPITFAPVLKTQWKIEADENRVLLPGSGSVEPTTPVLWPNGFEWIAQRGLALFALLAILSAALVAVRSLPIRVVGGLVAIGLSLGIGWNAWQQAEPLAALQVNLPVLASGEKVSLEVGNVPSWEASLSWPGIALTFVGCALLFFAWRIRKATGLLAWMGFTAVSVGLLMQHNGAPWFYGTTAIIIFLFRFLPDVRQAYKLVQQRSATGPSNEPTPDSGTGSIVTATVILFAASVGWLNTNAPSLRADDSKKASVPVANIQTSSDPNKDATLGAERVNVRPSNSLTQKWSVTTRDKRLTVSADMIVSGQAGDRFLVVRAPAVLTQFENSDVQLTKEELPGIGLAYIVTIPAASNNAEPKNKEGEAQTDNTNVEAADSQADAARQYTVQFQYQLDAVQFVEGIPVLTGSAALSKITLSYDEPSWEVVCEAAARIELMKDGADADKASASILLGPGHAKIQLVPPSRDLNSEATQFFVEAADLYTPGPGVIDGVHRLKFRTSQGRLQTARVVTPVGMTVSAVEGPISAWQFDVDNRRLEIQVAPSTPPEFVVKVQTQRSLESLPAEVQLSPLKIEGAVSEVGLMALAFGSETQPENVRSDTLSQVNLGDFDASLLAGTQATLHRVYRYGTEGGTVTLQVAPVSSEIRITSKQVVSFGDERIVLGINFVADIARTGVFQLSFRLPEGLEVESLTGESLHHWSELSEGGQRQIVLHLKGKTIGPQSFALTLAGATPNDTTDWAVPRFEVMESVRQTGELVVQPITGIRLRTTTRQNVSETDPRSLGAHEPGALGFRLLQQDWSLRLAIEKLAPWVTGQVLHDVTLREGQTRSTIMADFTVENAAIRTLLVKLPAMSDDEIKTMRASGAVVSDFVRSGQAENVWELRFKRRMIGPLKFQIEFERRGERAVDNELLNLFEFPEARQLGYYFAVRVGGRLEIEPEVLTQGWQRCDWSTVPQSLRESGVSSAPVLTLRAMAPSTPLSLKVIRHSLADALKLRVASGTLTTILSPTGDQLTSVDVNMEVIQRSSLSVQLPAGGELFSIFVNGESVHSIRQQGNNNIWQFYILPGIDERTAQVRFVYSLIGDNLSKLELVSPQLNVPLENIQWDVIAPSGFELTDSDGNLELVAKAKRDNYDRQAYMSMLQGQRQDEAKKATQLLEQANQWLQSGQQSKAQWALNNVSNRYALDAASNEDARVQLENLQTQQAIVGLNSRRQRLLLDNQRSDRSITDNEQLRQAAAINPILQNEQLNYRPQELSQLLAGNSKEDNAILRQIAGRMVQHQRSTEPVPQAIVISLPEDGNVYTFRRSVQVTENAPLQLQLQFRSQTQVAPWQWAVLAMLFALLSLAWLTRPVA